MLLHAMKKRFQFASVVLSIAMTVLVILFVKARNEPTEVFQVDSGSITGLKNKAGDILIFKGIPFAAPPVGDLRWKAPKLPEKWTGVKKCEDFGASPMQTEPRPFLVYTSEFLIPDHPIDEDCLYLNIWAPSKKSITKRPVFVWIYGGGFSSGGGNVPIYDGEAMAKKGVVFVSINYRVGVFGFLSHPGLTKESDAKASGNYGLLDQIAALKWIQKNIGAFGGDAGNVTIAGQSAGSMSVHCLVASPLAKGLFHRAIAESGCAMLPTSGINTTSLSAGEAQGIMYAQDLGAKTIDEMRRMSPEDLLVKSKLRFAPIIDGYVLPKPVTEIFAANQQNNVPLITGWNADEGLVFAYKTKEDFRKEAIDHYGENADTFLSYYPASTDEESNASQVALARDMIFALPDYSWANIQSDQKQKPVYVYNFTRRPPATGDFIQYRSFHTAEVGYALNNLAFINRPWDAIDHQLAQTMSSFWVNFAMNGDPNGKGLPLWPIYTTSENNVMVLNEKPTAQRLEDKDRLDFLHSILK